MSTTRSWDLLSPEQRKTTIQNIINFYQTERNESIGIIAAEELLDMFLEQAAPHIYNRGVEDAKNLLKTSMDTAILDLEASLKK